MNQDALREVAGSARVILGCFTRGLIKTKAISRAMGPTPDALEGDEEMGDKKSFNGPDDLHDGEHAAEAEERWGETDAYKESMRRAKRYSKDDWGKIKAEGEAVEARLAELLLAGRRPGDPDVMDAADAHRLHMDRWFYPVSHTMHVGLGRMYISDPRFAEHYEKLAPGLAAFLTSAIEANAARAGFNVLPEDGGC